MDPLQTLRRSALAWTPRVAMVIATVAIILASSSAAHADPSIAEIEAQINKAWNSLEPTIEEYNKVHSELQVNKKKRADLENALKPLELQVNLALSRVSNIAIQLYKKGPASTLTSILNSGSPNDLLDQLTIVNQISRSQMAEISSVTAVRDKYVADKHSLEALGNQLTTQDAELAKKRKSIEAEISRLQQLRQQVYGTAGAVGTLRPANCPYEYMSGASGSAATKACAQIGKPYVYGSSGPNSFDCSGLTMYAWADNISLPHNAAEQYARTTHISKSELRTGDLVFFYSPIHHVGIYVGGGWMVHAPSSGDYVRMALIDRYNAPTYYGRPKF